MKTPELPLPERIYAPKGFARRRSWDRWILVLLVLASFALHMWRIEAKGIWWDESLSLYRAQHDVPYILSNRIQFPGHSSRDLHPPLYFVVLHLATRLAGESDLVLRFPSVCWAALLVPLLYAMGRRLRGRRAGLMAALLGALSPFYLWYAQEARMYTMVTALGLASLYALWRALTGRSWKWGLAFALSAAAALATQYLFGILLAVEALLAICLWPRRADHPVRMRAIRKHQLVISLVGGGTILLSALGVLGYRAWQLIPTLAPGRTYISMPDMLRDALNSFSLGISVSPHKMWPYHILAALVFIVGGVSLWRQPPVFNGEGERAVGRRRGAALVILVGAILVPVVVMWIISLFVPIYMGSRYLIASSPAFYLGLAVGIDALAHRTRVVAPVVALVLLAGMGFSNYQYFYDPEYSVKEDHRAAAELISQQGRVGDVIVVTAPENIPAFEHYYTGSLPIVGMPRLVMTGDPDPVQVANDLQALTNTYDRIWLVHCRIEFSDPKERVNQWLDGNTMLLDRWSFPSTGSLMTVSSYLAQPPLHASPAPDTPPVGTFGNQLTLVDYHARYFGPDGAAQQVSRTTLTASIPSPFGGANLLARQGEGESSPSGMSQGGNESSAVLPAIGDGQTVGLTLYWEALAGLPSLKTSLRLVDDAGTLWAQEDREPYMYYPTDQWPVGQMVRHEAGLRVPTGTPPGVYHLQLWMYRAEDGQSLDFHNGAGEASPFLALGSVIVGATPTPATLSPDRAAREFLPDGVTQPTLPPRFGSAVELLGYALGPLKARPGDSVKLDLYWRARAQVGRDLELVVNWQDATGNTRYTSTHTLTGTDYTTSGWRAGQRVRGIVQVPVPQEAVAGSYTLHLLVRDRDSGKVLPLRNGPLPWGSRDLSIGTVTVKAPATGG